MQKFYYSIPTKVAFGRGEIGRLPEFTKEFGSKVLLVYGNSIKHNGIYETVMALLTQNGITVEELPGIRPNPDVQDVRKGIALCHSAGIEVLVAVGGGSVIDTAKAIGAGYFYDGDVWNLMQDPSRIVKRLPLIAISTLSATGSEMNGNFVLSDYGTGEKLDSGARCLYPDYAILDPSYTLTVPAYQTAAGTADMLCHVMELYFNGVPEAYLQDRLMEAVMKTCVRWGAVACKEPDNYEARANLMWASCLAINGLLSAGKRGPWPLHTIEAQLHRYANITHGHGLAVLTIGWLKHTLCEKTADMIAAFGENVLGLPVRANRMMQAQDSIKALDDFYKSLGLDTHLQALGLSDVSWHPEVAKAAAAAGLDQCFYPLHENDIIAILKLSY